MHIKIDKKDQGFWRGKKKLDHIFEEQLTVLTGVNGSGKTQLLKEIEEQSKNNNAT